MFILFFFQKRVGSRLLRHSLYNYKFRNSVLILNYPFGFFLQLSSFEVIMEFLFFIKKQNLFFNNNFIICSKYFFIFLKLNNQLNFFDKSVFEENFRGIVVFVGFNSLSEYIKARNVVLNLNEKDLILSNKVCFLSDWFFYYFFFFFNSLNFINLLYIYFMYFIYICMTFFNLFILFYLYFFYFFANSLSISFKAT